MWNIRYGKIPSFYMVKNNLLKDFLPLKLILTVSATEVKTEDRGKDREVAFSSSKLHWGGCRRGALFFMAVDLCVLEVPTVENVSKSSSI